MDSRPEDGISEPSFCDMIHDDTFTLFSLSPVNNSRSAVYRTIWKYTKYNNLRVLLGNSSRDNNRRQMSSPVTLSSPTSSNEF